MVLRETSDVLRKGARKIWYPFLAFGPGDRRMRMERKLTEEERRELAIVSLAYELQDEYCEDPIEGNELLDEYYQMAKEDLYGKEGRDDAR